MLPHAYELPAAIVILIGGVVACFAGHRLFRIVLAIYGFILGSMLASSVMGITNTIGMIVAAVLGGVIGAVILMFAYFVGIALAGASLGALLVHMVWNQAATGDPSPIVVIVMAVVGAIGALLLQRYVIIVATAFGGAWTIIVGGLALAEGGKALGGSAQGAVWILYPMTPAPGQRWVPIAWVVLGLAGTAVQLGVTARKP